MFALGDPAALAAAYQDAGFREVTVEVARVQRRFPSLAVAIQNVRDTLPEIPQLLTLATDAERAAAWADLDEIREEAMQSAREIMSEQVLKGKAPNHCAFIIEDENGKTVLTFPFKLALQE